MNTKILQKCLEELKKDTPDLSYLRGTLETLIEVAGGQVLATPGYIPAPTYPPTGLMAGANTKVDEETDEEKEYARKMAGGPIARLDN